LNDELVMNQRPFRALHADLSVIIAEIAKTKQKREKRRVNEQNYRILQSFIEGVIRPLAYIFCVRSYQNRFRCLKGFAATT
jgi:hypothetical protein